MGIDDSLAMSAHPSVNLISDEWNEYWLCPRNGCGRRYKHKYNLKAHLNYECGVPRKFKCSTCEKTFAQRRALKSHMIMKHKLLL